nr:Uncharacterised protein [Enterobacter mori]
MYTVFLSPMLHAITGPRLQPLEGLLSRQTVEPEPLVELHNVNLDAPFASLSVRVQREPY